MIRADAAIEGRCYRTSQPHPGTYYTLPPKKAAAVVRRWKEHPENLVGAARFTLRRVQEGWILMRRHIRFLTAKGERRERTDWATLEPSYLLREVKRPPGYDS